GVHSAGPGRAVAAGEEESHDLLPFGLGDEQVPTLQRVRQRPRVDDLREVPADQLVRAEPDHLLDRLGDEREVALDVGREDDIRRVLDEEPVALLALAQLPLEALPLGDVAGGALDPGEHAVAPDAYRADLERADAAVALLEVHPRRQ